MVISLFNTNTHYNKIVFSGLLYDANKKCFIQNDKIHRLNGPAVIYSNGIKIYGAYNDLFKVSTKKDFLKELTKKSLWSKK